MADKLEASRLTPETLHAHASHSRNPWARASSNPPDDDGDYGAMLRGWVHMCADAWAADIADSGKRIPTEFLGRPIAYWVELDNYAKERNVDKLIGEIERLREQLLVRQVEALELAEQLRAYRGAERIAHDQMEAPGED